MSTLAGSAGSFGSTDGAGASARFFTPSGIAADGAGDLFVADSDNDTIRQITGSGLVTTIAGLLRSPGSADGARSAARFNHPSGVAVDRSGRLYVADTYNDTIRSVAPDGVVTTLAAFRGSSAPTMEQTAVRDSMNRRILRLMALGICT